MCTLSWWWNCSLKTKRGYTEREERETWGKDSNPSRSRVRCFIFEYVGSRVELTLVPGRFSCEIEIVHEPGSTPSTHVKISVAALSRFHELLSQQVGLHLRVQARKEQCPPTHGEGWSDETHPVSRQRRPADRQRQRRQVSGVAVDTHGCVHSVCFDRSTGWPAATKCAQAQGLTLVFDPSGLRLLSLSVKRCILLMWSTPKVAFVRRGVCT